MRAKIVHGQTQDSVTTVTLDSRTVYLYVRTRVKGDSLPRADHNRLGAVLVSRLPISFEKRDQWQRHWRAWTEFTCVYDPPMSALEDYLSSALPNARRYTARPPAYPENPIEVPAFRFDSESHGQSVMTMIAVMSQVCDQPPVATGLDSN